MFSNSTVKYLFNVIAEKLIKEKLISGKLVLLWSHEVIKEIARKRYLQNQDTLRNTHSELANLFFNEFTDSDENSESEAADEPGTLYLLFVCFKYDGILFEIL